MARKTILTSLAALSLLAVSSAQAGNLDYSYFQIGYVSTEIDVQGYNFDGDGLAIGGSVAINQQFHIFASYSDQDFDFDVNSDALSIGIGYSHALADSTDFIASIGYASGEVSHPTLGSYDDDGYSVGLALRSKVANNVELIGGVTYVDFSDTGSDTTVSIGVGFDVTDAIQVGGGFSTVDGDTSYNVGIRFYFGK